MARDPAHLRRLYGDGPAAQTAAADPRLPSGSSVLPALWVVGLALLGLLATGTALGVLALGFWAGQGPLGEWGVIAPDDAALFVHDHSPRSDASAGCVVTQDRLIRWENRQPVAELLLAGAVVTVDDVGVHATAADGRTVDCPFARGENSWPFATTAARIAKRR